jgi:hypothetical protein
MAKLSTDLRIGVLHPRENIFLAGTLGALNAEVIVAADGCGVVSLDLRGVFNMSIEVSGTVDGVNWQMIPMLPINQASKVMVATVVGAVLGNWIGSCVGYRQVRARCTAYTSGSATVTVMASQGAIDQVLGHGSTTSNTATAVGAAGAAVTLTLAAPGAGLRHHLTYLSINRFAAALLTAAAVPVTVTTTNLPTSLAFSFPADAAAQGSLFPWREDFAFPFAVSAQNTATTIVAPVTTGVIWRITAGFQVAP